MVNLTNEILKNSDVENYLDVLPENIDQITLGYQPIYFIPDLKRFSNLIFLNCCNNQLKSLPNLPQSLKVLYCPNNDLEELPELPHTLRSLYCYKNKLKYLPHIPTTLTKLYCSYNCLFILPELPRNIYELRINDNPLIYKDNTIECIRYTNRIIAKCKYTFYCLKYKNKFRDWLWVKIRKPKIEAQYHPSRVFALLEQGVDIFELDTFLDVIISNHNQI